MKSITLFILVFFMSFSLLAQGQKKIPAFKVEVIGDGPALIMIPGLACSGAVWTETVKQLSADFQCHVLTLAGFSDQPALPSKDASYLSTIQSELVAYIKKEKLDRPILLGHSLGGFLSLSTAIAQPDLLEKIIIVDSYPFYTAAMNPMATMDQAKQQGKMMQGMLLNQTDSMYRVQQEQMMLMMATAANDVAKIVDWSVQSDRVTVGEAMYELMTTDLRSEVAKVKCSILVLGAWYAGKNYGLTKEIVKNNFKAQYQGATNCQIEMAETAKHFIMFDEPEWFYTTIKAFL